MKIAVSACLLGIPCRYDGASKENARVVALREKHELVPICPEVLGGMPIPHPPCEILRNSNPVRVIDKEGIEHTEAFLRGAKRAAKRTTEQGCKLAILKSKSPSCSTSEIYDGSFSGTLIPGLGLFALALQDTGIKITDEHDLSLLDNATS